MDYEQSVAYFTQAALFGAHKNGLTNIRELLGRLGKPPAGLPVGSRSRHPMARVGLRLHRKRVRTAG